MIFSYCLTLFSYNNHLLHHQ